MSYQKRSRNRGMTLLETLVAVAIIAVLLTIVGTRYHHAKQAAFNTQMKAELRDLITAQEAFYHSASMRSKGARYAESLEQLAFVLQEHVIVEMRSGVRGWAAQVTSLELPPEEYACTFYVGEIEPYSATATAGEMECEP